MDEGLADMRTMGHAAYMRVTQAVADRHTDGQMDGQTLCDNKG